MTTRSTITRTAGALAAAAAFALVPATAAHADEWCKNIVVEDSGHTVGQHCTNGPVQYDEYRVIVQFCGASGCWTAHGNWKAFGEFGRSKAHSDYGTYNMFLGLNGR